jgi:hypothetical protein
VRRNMVPNVLSISSREIGQMRTDWTEPKIETIAFGTLCRERDCEWQSEAEDWSISQGIPEDGGRAAEGVR